MCNGLVPDSRISYLSTLLLVEVMPLLMMLLLLLSLVDASFTLSTKGYSSSSVHVLCHCSLSAAKVTVSLSEQRRSSCLKFLGTFWQVLF